MKAKQIVKDVLFYAFSPLAILCIAKIVLMITSNALAALIAASLATSSYIFIVVPIRESHWVAESNRQIQVVLTTLAFGGVLVWYLHSLSLHVNPWGSIGWVCLIGIFLLFAILIMKKDSEDSMCSLLRVISILLAISATYLLFGSQLIWIPLVFYALQTLFVVSRLRSFDIEENLNVKGSTVAVIVIGGTSTMFQFWFANVGFGYDFWQLLLAVVIIVIIAIPGYHLFMFLKDRKEVKVLAAKEALEKPERERLAKENLEKTEKAAQERKQKGIELFEALKKADKLTWQEILYIVCNYDYRISSMPFEVIVKADFLSLIEISDTKNKLYWDHSNMEKALTSMDSIAHFCYNDDILNQLIGQVKKIEKYSEYQGYNALIARIKYWNSLGDLVQIKEQATETRLLEN